MRFAIAWVVVIAAGCDAYSGPKPQPAPALIPERRDVQNVASLKLQDLEIHHVPRHGIIHGLFGMGGYRLVEVVDLDSERVSVTLQDWDPSRGNPFHEGEVVIPHDQIAGLRDHGERAWREQQHGKDPQVTDVGQVLIVIDGDDAFETHATMFQAQRPEARATIEAIDALDKQKLDSFRLLDKRQRVDHRTGDDHEATHE